MERVEVVTRKHLNTHDCPSEDIIATINQSVLFNPEVLEA